jgi:hypothetical protein
MDRHTGVQTDRYRKTNSQIAGKQAERQADTQAERQTDRWRTARHTSLKYLLVLYH